MNDEKKIFKGEFEELNVNFISILRGKQPANRRKVVIRSLGNGEDHIEMDLKVTKIIKGEKPIIYICVYEPDEEDTQGDMAKAALIKRACHNFMKKGYVSMIDENHNFIPGAGTLVENQILNSTDDDRYPDIKKGAWVGGIEPDDSLLPFLDEITGVSLAGTGTYKADAEPVKQEKASTPQMRARTDFRHARAISTN